MSVEQPEAPPQHPSDHEPYWLFLRQVRRPVEPHHEEVVDVFYCARCLGRVDVLDSVVDAGQHPGEIGAAIRPRIGPLPTLGGGALIPRQAGS